MPRLLLRLLVVVILLAPVPTGGVAADTLAEIRARDSVICAVGPQGSQMLLGDPSAADGLIMDADFCRALAAAVLGDPGKVTSLVTTVVDRVDAIMSGVADIGFGGMAQTASRDQKVVFPIVVDYVSQGFMAPASLGLRRVAQARDATVCVIRGTTSEARLQEGIRQLGWSLTLEIVTSAESLMAGYNSGRCQLVSSDVSTLYRQRILHKLPADRHVLLDDRLGLEPLGPMVRRDDPDWAFVVRWVLNALILAEEMGIGQDNVQTAATSSADPKVRRLLGLEPHPLMELGLPADALARAIAAVGNYGQIHARNFGRRGDPDSYPRGANALVRDGGLLYAFPYR